MNTSDTVIFAAGIGGFVPLLTAVVQQPFWSAPAKRIVAVIVALVVGVVTVASTGGIDQFTHGLPTLGTIAAVLATSQAAHDLLWKPSTITAKIESATSPKRGVSA
ncbi:hypothetical protein ACIQ9R_36375 [Streptomyces sp. NPDC094447]|uniref:hypothetical protein n=1 Tax=Streptomyces sp. NPDC094447 TaxID=3366062 RepID=UPI00382D6EC5